MGGTRIIQKMENSRVVELAKSCEGGKKEKNADDGKLELSNEVAV